MRPQKSSISILSAATTVGSATLLSRIAGLVRDIMIASFLGTGFFAEIFVIAFRLPNLFRRIFAEGAFSAAFVPLFARRHKKNPVEAQQLATEIFSGLAFILVIFSALAQIFMPYLVLALAQGFRSDESKFLLTIYYSRISFFYLIFMSLMAFFAAMLNARGRFFTAATAPIILNIVLIGALLLAHALHAMPLAFLVWGIALAGGLQLLWVIIDASRYGLGFKLARPRFTPDVRRLFKLALPGVLAASINQINLLIGTSIATSIAGAAAWLYYADRLYQLPMGVIGIALSSALLPSLARALETGQRASARHQQNQTIALSMLFTLPAAVGLFVLAVPIVELLFERGAFHPADTIRVAWLVQLFCLGLPAFVLIRVLQPAFFARGDTRSPLIDGAIGVGVNITLILIFFDIYGAPSIAAATSLAGWVSALLMVARLARQKIWYLEWSLARLLLLQCVAAGTMGFVLTQANAWIADMFGSTNFIGQTGILVGYIVGSVVFYFGVVGIFGRGQIAMLKNLRT